ncbi:hypothetical protein U1Q18_013952 [Sarracenia purpurea var. burkii]
MIISKSDHRSLPFIFMNQRRTVTMASVLQHRQPASASISGDHSTAVRPPLFSGRNIYHYSGSISTHSWRFANLTCKNSQKTKDRISLPKPAGDFSYQAIARSELRK